MNYTQEQYNEAYARASKGAKKLRAFDPEWANCITLSELRMNSAAHCIGGQVARHHEEIRYYGELLTKLDILSIDDAVVYGFDANFMAPSSMEFAYAALHAAWRTIVLDELGE